MMKRDAATGEWIEVIEVRNGGVGTGGTVDVSGLATETTLQELLSKNDIQNGHTARLQTIQSLLEGVNTKLAAQAAKTETQPVEIVGGSTGGGTTGGATEETLADLLTALNLLAKKTETQPVSIDGGPTLAKQNDILTSLSSMITHLNAIVKKTETQPVSSTSIETILGNILVAIAAQADLSDTQPVSIDGVSTSTLQSSILSAVQALTKPSDVQIIKGQADTYTPTLTRTTTSGTISSGSSAVVVTNVGSSNGVFLSATLKVGESIPMSAPLGATLTALAYDATGTEFVIITMNKN